MQPGANLYTQGFGTRPESVEVPHIDTRAPAATDTGQGFFTIGKRWVDKVAGNEYCLTSFSSSNGATTANWAFLGSSSGDLNTLTTDDATIVTPTAGTIILKGNATQGVSTTGSNAPGTVNVTAADWTTSQKGVGILSSNAQAIAGSGTTQAVTPAALQAKVGTQTAHGVALGNTGATSAVSWSAAGTSGQAFISGGASADGAYGTLGVAGGGTGAVTLTGLALGSGTSAFTGVTYTAATSYTPAFSLATAGDSAWTYSTQFGRYTQIGAVVYFSASLTWSNFANTTGSGVWRVSLPVAAGAFTLPGQVAINGTGVDASAQTANLPANLYGKIATGASVVTISLQEGGVGNATAASFDLTVTQVKTAGTLTISGFYFAA